MKITVELACLNQLKRRTYKTKHGPGPSSEKLQACSISLCQQHQWYEKGVNGLIFEQQSQIQSKKGLEE
jgi:hypothetical protein